MIPVTPQPEPTDFESKVRRPGQTFLSSQPLISQKSWKTHSYWLRVFPELYATHQGICAYSCLWIPRDIGAGTVDHYCPKSKYPVLAYEWSNYRLANRTCNGRKRDHDDVLDPFEIGEGWFTLDFPSLLIRPGASLEQQTREQVQATINRLCLNDEAALETRLSYLEPYCTGDASFQWLQAHAPFIASELQRQGLVDTIQDMMKLAL